VTVHDYDFDDFGTCGIFDFRRFANPPKAAIEKDFIDMVAKRTCVQRWSKIAAGMKP
jgi:hypothetical protein